MLAYPGQKRFSLADLRHEAMAEVVSHTTYQRQTRRRQTIHSVRLNLKEGRGASGQKAMLLPLVPVRAHAQFIADHLNRFRAHP